MKIKKKIPKPSSAKEEIVFGWWVVSKGCRLEDDGIDFNEDNEETILIPSFIDLKNKK